MGALPWIIILLLLIFLTVKLIVMLRSPENYAQELKEYQKSHYYKQTRHNYNAVANDPGLLGEYQVARQLQQYIPKGAKLLYNLYIPYKGGDTEVDIVMIHSSGIYVFESKNYRGIISGTKQDKLWTQYINGQSYSFYNPLHQNNTHVAAVRKIVGETVNIHPMVVFGQNCILSLVKPRVGKAVIKMNELTRRVNAVMKYGYTPLSTAQINDLYQQLKSYTQVSIEQKMAHNNTYTNMRCPRCSHQFPVPTTAPANKRIWEEVCPHCNVHILRNKEKV